MSVLVCGLAAYEQEILMIGIVIVTHGGLAREFQAALEHVMGGQEQLETISIGPDDDIETRRQDIAEAAARVNSGQGVVILTDMLGSTPANLAMSMMDVTGIEVLSGLNLPMLVKLACVRTTHELAESTALARDAGIKYISMASEEPVRK